MADKPNADPRGVPVPPDPVPDSHQHPPKPAGFLTPADLRTTAVQYAEELARALASILDTMDPLDIPRGFVHRDGVMVLVCDTTRWDLGAPENEGLARKWLPCGGCGRLLRLPHETQTATCQACFRNLRWMEDEPVEEPK